MLHFQTLLSVIAVLDTVQAVRYLGRVNPATKELTWSGTGVTFTFTGSSATINFSSVTGANNVELVVDGVAPLGYPNFSSQSISTPANLTNGTHTVEFIKRSEALWGSLFVQDVTTDGTFGADPPESDRKIEVIGDSITAGYGIGAKLPCVNSAALTDITQTYGVVTAEALKADYHIIAWSGRGIYRNYVTAGVDTSPIMPQYYSRYGANDADNSYTFPSSWTPDAVVINLGTNDFSYLIDGSAARPKLDPPTYISAMVKLARDIQTRYPNASLFFMSSPLLNDDYPSAEDAQKTTQINALNDVISQLNTTHAYLVDWPSQGSDVGCDYHPTPATNLIGANLLTASISKALGW